MTVTNQAYSRGATWLNAEKMARYRDEMRKYYYDPSKYDTYLPRLGIS
jgi:aminobenzoyl-glutamate utilization protein B